MRDRNDTSELDESEQARRNAEMILDELCRMIDSLKGVADDRLVRGLEGARDEAIRTLMRLPERRAQ